MSRASDSANAMKWLSTGTIIAVSVTSVIVLAFCAILLLLARLISDHRRLVRDLESHGIVVQGRKHRACAKAASRTRLIRRPNPLSSIKTGPNPLESTDTIESKPVYERSQLQASDKWPRTRGSLTAARIPLTKPPIMLKELKPVTSPETNEYTGMIGLSSSPSPPPPFDESSAPFKRYSAKPTQETSSKAEALKIHHNSPSQEDLCPRPLFSKDPEGSGTGALTSRKCRARTIGTTDGLSRQQTQLRLPSHCRSFSLGSQNPGCCPQDPVPPLPLNADDNNKSFQSKVGASSRTSLRHSVSSVDSIGSSLLIGSPKATRSSSVRLKNGANREWKNSVIIGPRPLRKAKSLHHHGVSWSGHKSLRSNRSIHSCEGRYSIGTSVSQQTLDKEQVSPDIILQPSQRSSIVNSSREFLEKVISANRLANNGEPPCRQPSSTHGAFSAVHRSSFEGTSPNSPGISSTRSSNGNPFQWDLSPVQFSKPSALKGSPNARKGHKRQNCVRICVPTTVVNRARSSMLSTGDILEDPSQPESHFEANLGATNVSCRPRSLPRPPSTSIFAPEITTPLTSPPPSDHGRLYSSPPSNRVPKSLNSIARSPGSSYVLSIPSLQSPPHPPNSSYNASMPFSFDGPANSSDDKRLLPVEFKLLARPITPRKLSSQMEAVASGGHEDSPIESTALLKNAENQEVSGCDTSTYDPPQCISPSSFHKKSTVKDDSPPCSPKSQPSLGRNHSASSAVGQHDIVSFTEVSGSPKEEHGQAINEEKPSPVRFSIAALRRMNSDAMENAKADRQYLGFADRQGSPTPRQGSRSRCDSWTSLQSEPRPLGMCKTGDDSIIGFESEVDLMLGENNSSWLSPDKSLSEMDKLIEATEELVIPKGDFGLCTIVETDSTDLQFPSHRNSWTANNLTPLSPFDVWEDGEDTTSRKPLKESPDRPVLFKTGNGKSQQNKATVELKLIPPSSPATPKSLYDENGFYREDDNVLHPRT